MFWPAAIWALVLSLPFTPLAAQADAADAPPRIVLILVDDLGWMDLGCQGNDFVDTPAIDALAASGLRFTDAYASGPVCSPTRCAIQSGQNQARIGITDFIPGHFRPFERVTTPRPRSGLPLEVVTVAETLGRAGLATGYIGKWHLGPVGVLGPARQGYDLALVIEGPHLPGRYRVASGSAPAPGAGQFRTEYEAARACEFLREHRDGRFFLMVSPFAVHIPLASSADKVAKYERRAEQRGTTLPHPVYAALIEQVDDLVAEVVRTLDELGIAASTMVVVTSDNGGLNRRYDYREAADDVVATQAPLRDEKGSLYEGGIRVPLIVRYPAVVPAGTRSATPVVSHDLYPTFAAVAGADLPRDQPLDGVDLLPLLRDPDVEMPTRALRWHYPHYHHGRPASAVREGDHKLIEYLDGSGDVELYDLAQDIGEQRDLAAEQAALAQRMRRELAEWRRRVTAAMPHPNPSHDPTRAAEWWSVGTGQQVPSDRRRPFPHTERDR